jgi:FAD/FMN-containing dehydrogenase
MQNLINQLTNILDAQYILLDDQDKAPYLTDWRKRFTGKALAVVLPCNSTEVAQIVKLCTEHRVAIVPQGGNTGFCGGATPDNTGTQIILNLKRMNQIREIDALNQTITLEAGCILQTVQEKTSERGFLFPLSLGA